MRQVNIVFALGLLTLSNCVYSLAPTTNKREPIYLKADTVEFNNTTHQGRYLGNVQLDQGNAHLTANKAKTYANKNNQLTLAIAYGGKKQAHYWSLPEGKKQYLHAYADTIKYFAQKNQIHLIGHAKVTQGDDVMKAPLIIYDTKTQHVISKGNRLSRTTITVQPKRTTT